MMPDQKDYFLDEVAVSGSYPLLLEESRSVKTSFLNVLAEALNTIEEVIMIVDNQSKILYSNSAYTRVIKVPVNRVLGKKLSAIDPNAKTLQVLRTGEPFVRQAFRIQTAGVDVVATILPVHHESQLIGAVTVINEDQADQQHQGSEAPRQKIRSNLLKSFETFVGRNSRFVAALSLARRIATYDVNALICGESGVGKEPLAVAIHSASSRRERALVKVNCAAIPETLLETELFGYEEGSFTGARRGGKVGKFELADGGTVFLDEIGNMSLAMQAKLLRVLQEREFERVGGNRSIRVNVRVLAATNSDLEAMMRAGNFRQDLYYRLNVVQIHLPPLRERKDDLPLLVEYFLKYYSQIHKKKILGISESTMEILQGQRWPGNVRELANAVEHAVVITSEEVIEPRSLPPYLRATVEAASTPTRVLQGRKLRDVIAEVEKDALVEALRLSSGNRSKAIEILGLSRATFYEKLKQHGIRSPEHGSVAL